VGLIGRPEERASALHFVEEEHQTLGADQLRYFGRDRLERGPEIRVGPHVGQNARDAGSLTAPLFLFFREIANDASAHDEVGAPGRSSGHQRTSAVPKNAASSALVTAPCGDGCAAVSHAIRAAAAKNTRAVARTRSARCRSAPERSSRRPGKSQPAIELRRE